MSGLIQILLKHITKICIFIKVHIPSKIVYIQLQVQVSLSLSHWYPGSGVVLDCIDS